MSSTGLASAPEEATSTALMTSITASNASTMTSSTSSSTAAEPAVASLLPLEPSSTTPAAAHNQVFLRPYTLADAPAVALLANNPKVAANMRNRFPSPYTLADATSWLTSSAHSDGPQRKHFAICRASDGAYVGGIGAIPGTDVEHRTWEMGYWLGEPFWGQGLATDAAIAFARWIFETYPQVVRLEAGVFEPNIGSQRVVTKAGFTFEGRRRNAVEKKGKVMDILMYSLLREECLGNENGE